MFSHTPSALNAGAKRSGATCHMAMPQCCYLAKGAKRPSHTTNMQPFQLSLFTFGTQLSAFGKFVKETFRYTLTVVFLSHYRHCDKSRKNTMSAFSSDSVIYPYAYSRSRVISTEIWFKNSSTFGIWVVVLIQLSFRFRESNASFTDL